MPPYSLDLRKRVLAAVDAGKMSHWDISLLFDVSPAWIRRLLQRRRETGEIAPKSHNGGPVPKLNAEHRQHLVLLVCQQRDATLSQLAEWLERDVGVQVSEATICRALQALNLPLKKSRFTPANRRGPTCKSNEPSMALP